MRKGAAVPVFLTTIVLIVSACATRAVSPPVNLQHYNRVQVTVTGATPEGAERAAALRELIVQGLRDEGLFDQVGSAEAGGELAIRVEIIDVKQVSNLERINLGQVAGSNEVDVEVALSDALTSHPLTTFRLRARSPRWAPISPDWPWGSVDEALQRVADGLVQRLRQWRDASASGA